MRWKLMAAATLVLAGTAAAQQPRPVDAATSARLRQAGAEVLFWSQAQRDANFRRMEQLFPTVTIKAGGKVRVLPRGRPLAVPAAEVDRYLAEQNIAGLIVLQDGKVRLERYARGFGPAGRWTTFSVAKSLTSTLFGAAVKDGKLSLDDQVTRFIPEMRGSAYDGVTVRQVLTMSSGAKWNENYSDPKSDVAQMFSRPVAANEDVIVAYMKTLGRAAAPGTKFNYNTGETNLAGTILSRAVGMPISRYASVRVWRPYGMEADAFWQVDEHGREIAGCCVSMRLRDYARIGQLQLEQGHGLLAPGWVADATRIHVPFPQQPGWGYGYFWWVQPGGYRASGIFGQQIWMDPARHVVIAAVAAWPKAVDDKMAADRQAFFHRLAEAASR
ncbi:MULTISPECIES: serine hydrolase domain-containing protein [Sphingomonas]|uniref:serine hydrolase domain-containing protein n=1 Tax=Sphingomonas TaxID=13687 RepID=UPI000DEEE029|nr:MULTISPECIES: serine hydrolase domain-containing protein [Sphingomonas]